MKLQASINNLTFSGIAADVINRYCNKLFNVTDFLALIRNHLAKRLSAATESLKRNNNEVDPPKD